MEPLTDAGDMAEKGEPVLRRMVRHKVNRKNEGIERLFLAQAPNQYGQHMADWVHIFFHLASVLSTPKLIPSISPNFPLSI